MQIIGIIGIHTEIGKTISSTVIVEALQCDYWKPIQAGALENSDTITVKSLISNPISVVHPEAFRLKQAMSPHAAAQRENIEIKLDNLKLPNHKNNLVLETAGGLLSPINPTQTNLDLILHFQIPVLLVSKSYLGSINHTMLTIKVLEQNNIIVKGILFNGKKNTESENFILQNSKLKCFGYIEEIEVNQAMISSQANRLKEELKKIF